MLTLKLALAEIKSNRTFAFLYILSLALGLLGLSTLDSLKTSIRAGLDQRAKGFLAADLGVGSRRPLKDDELKLIGEIVPAASARMNLRESFTMIASGEHSRLVELRVIEPSYPYYGEIQLNHQGVVNSTSTKDLFSGPNVWVYPELLTQLGLRENEELKIGNGTFKVSDEVLLDSAGAGSDIGFAPPVYISSAAFATTGLQQTGSLAFYTLLFKLPEGSDGEVLAKLLNKNLADPEIEIFTPRNASEQIGRLLNYLSDYLSLAGLVALLLASVGQIYLLRNYFVRHLRDIAILKSLGLRERTIVTVYFVQLFILSLVAVIPVLLFTKAVLPLFAPLLSRGLHINFMLELPPSTSILVLAIALLQMFALSGPILLETVQVRVQSLFLAGANQETPPSRWLMFAPAALLFVALTVYLAHSAKVSGTFLALLVLAILGFAVFFRIFLAGLSRLQLAPPWSLAVLHARSRVGTTFAAFLAIAVAALLANLIPQIESNIHDDVSAPSPGSQPSLFLYDIQAEQIDGIKNLVTSLGAPPMQTAPMVRARLATVNGVPFVKPERNETWSREKESENRSRNRGYNLSFAPNATPYETIIRGHPFDLGSQKAQISLEKRFAERMNFKLGDHLKFDVQGVDVEGEVVNFRKVKWTTFQPNFFIRFSPGPLDEAPKTYLMTLGALDEPSKNRVQTQVVQNFSNVAIIDVSRMVARILNIIDQLSVAMRIMALFATGVGIMILFFILYNQIYGRRREANLLKVLGASQNFIVAVFMAEALSITGLAILLGAGLSFVVSFCLSHFIFDGLFSPDFAAPIFIGLIIFAVAASVTYALVKTVFDGRASRLLHSE